MEAGGWHRIDPVDVPEEGRVRSVTVGGRTVALARCRGQLGALENRCPHQGGPLGEGSIEKGWLRCPWHGYDYDPLTGRPPGAFSDGVAAYAVEERADGVYVRVPAVRKRRRTVGDLLVETLVAFGITHVFGMVGHSNLGFADAMRRAEERGELTYIGVRHEGRLLSRPARTASCAAVPPSVSRGPGSTNMLTGLYDAKLDQAPVLAISGQVPSAVLGRGAFQDLDLTAVFGDVAAWTTSVHGGSDHAELAALAVKHALDARGVAHLVRPDEVQTQPSDAVAKIPQGRLAGRLSRPGQPELARAAALIQASRRPVLIAGHGARQAREQVRALAERLNAPVLTTFKAKGLIPDTDPLGAGVLGRSGTPVASWLMNEADLLIVTGASFSNHTGIAPYKTILQIDDDPAAIGRFDAVSAGLVGSAALTLTALLGCLTGTRTEDQRPDVAARWAIWRAEKARRADDDRGHGVSTAAGFDALSRHLPEDAVVTVDVGNHAYSLGRYLESKGQPVQLTTAVKYAIPVKHVLLDNHSLGKIGKEQRAAGFPVWHTSLHNPDWAAYAELCGATGIKAVRREQLDASMARLFAADGPAMLHIEQDPELL